MDLDSIIPFLALCLAIQYQVIFSLYNAALYKPAWQSSTRDGRIPNFGNDGIMQTQIGSSFMGTETDYDNPAWWMVDLKGQYVIEKIVFTNRDDWTSCAHRLRNFQIDVFKIDPKEWSNFLTISGDVCFTRTDPVDGGTFTWNCTTPVTGRYVRLIRYAEDYFNIIEIQVMVSQEFLSFSSFTRRSGSLLDAPFIVSVNVSSPKDCVQRCLKLRSESRCTAFNWVTSNNECQFLSIDTRQKYSILSSLTSFTGANFYMESDSLVSLV